MVDYDFAREERAGEILYSTERLDHQSCDWADLKAVMERLRGELRPDQFDGMSFDAARAALAKTAGLPLEQVKTLSIFPEAGFHGLVHGDLHHGNLLRNKAGRPVTIDLDRVQRGPRLISTRGAARRDP